jgi:DNA-binding PadR family transcriptional regulator
MATIATGAGENARRAIEAALPLRPRDLFVLVVLAEGDLHGYGIMKEVERLSRGSVTLEVGSLYRTLDRLLQEGLIEDSGSGASQDAPAPQPSDGERRRNYRLTALGGQVVRAEAARLEGVVRLVRARGLLSGTGEAV